MLTSTTWKFTQVCAHAGFLQAGRGARWRTGSVPVDRSTEEGKTSALQQTVKGQTLCTSKAIIGDVDGRRYVRCASMLT